MKLNYLVPPWNHQIAAIEAAKTKSEYALFFEMGAGKTSTCINILRYKFALANKVLPTLIFCPPIVIENWRREFGIHSRVQGDVVTLTGSQPQRVKIFRGHMGKAKIFVTNYEALLMKELYALFKIYAPQCLVLDESHKCKDLKSKRTKAVIPIADMSKFRYLLTGSPVLNSPMDIFAQFRILDGGQTFGKNFFVFRATYFYDANAGMPRDKYFPNWQIKPGGLDEINHKISTKGMRVLKKDCMDLPPLVRQEIYVPLTIEQQKLYKEMQRDFISYVQDKACVATMALTKALRLMQIVTGFVSLEDMDGNHENRAINNTRASVLRELLEEITPNAKVLVWAVFKENYRAIREVLDDLQISYVEVHGDIPHAEKLRNVDKFNTDPRCRVFLGHPGSGGIGINLVAASYAIFYSRNFSLEQDLQAEARNHRGGSEIHAKLTRIDLVSPGTIDELVSKRLYQKLAISDAILKDMILKEVENGSGQLGDASGSTVSKRIAGGFQ